MGKGVDNNWNKKDKGYNVKNDTVVDKNSSNNIETDLDDDNDNKLGADIIGTKLLHRPKTPKNLTRTITICNDIAAMEHIELTDGVGQHHVDQLITQFEINKLSVEMNEIKLALKDNPDKIFGRVVCINMLKEISLFGISSSEFHVMAQSRYIVHRKDVFRWKDAKHGFVGFSCRHKSSVFTIQKIRIQ